MSYEFEKHYNQGIQYKQEGKHELSAQSHIKALEFDQDTPEAWHNAGAALLRISKAEEAQPYLQRALLEYDKKIEEDEQTAYYLFWKACVYALLQDKANMLLTLKDAFQHNPKYAEEAQTEEDFDLYREDADLNELIKTEIEALKILLYKGESLRMKDLNEEQLAIRQAFVDELAKHQWKVDDWERMFQAEFAVYPQAMGEYCQNNQMCIRLSFHIDQSLVFMELVNRQTEAVQAYRLYFEKGLSKILEVVFKHQDTLTAENWVTLIKELIPLCKEVLYEMPNGMKMKLTR
jgi:tetratricopeptide (TPR) repeat protein